MATSFYTGQLDYIDRLNYIDGKVEKIPNGFSVTKISDTVLRFPK